MKLSVNVEDYRLEGKELAAAGAIKYMLEKMSAAGMMTVAEALERLDDPVGLLQELTDTITVDELDTGNRETRQTIVDLVKTINPAEALDEPSEDFREFLSECRAVLEREWLTENSQSKT